MSTIRTDVDHVESGAWVFNGTVTLPASSVSETQLTTAALLPAAKLVHRFAKDHRQVTGTAITAKTEHIHIAQYAGIVKAAYADIHAAITGDNTVVIDIHRSTAAGAFATILSSTLTINSGTVVRTATALTIDATKDDYVAGDVFEIIVTVAGSGTQAQGLNVTVFFEERAA